MSTADVNTHSNQQPCKTVGTMATSRTEQLRDATKRFIREHHEGNTRRAAQAMGLTQSHLHNFCNDEDSGVGIRLLEGLAPHLPEDVAHFIGLPLPSEAPEPGKLPQLERVMSSLSAAYSPPTMAYARMLLAYWKVDRPFGEWAEMLTTYNDKHS